MRLASTTILAAATALALSACGDDPGTSPDGEGPTVTVQDTAFQDQSATVPAGTPVTWDNQDSVPHTVTSGTPDEATGVFDEELPAGEQVTVTVDEAGTYPYWCRVHPSMTAELVVEPAAQ